MKYAFVWIGSILLNTWGTFAMTEFLRNSVWLRNFLGYMVDDVFIFSKITVSLLVGFLWNYNMQNYFVYKERNFGKYFWKKRGVDISNSLESLEIEEETI